MMTSDKYILGNDNRPIQIGATDRDLMLWAIWFENSASTRERIVATTRVPFGGNVSTVFLGIDHNFGDQGPPILWETLIFGGVLDGDGARYTSHEDALAGHSRMVERVKASRSWWARMIARIFS